MSSDLVYIIQTVKGSSYGYRYSQKLKKLYLKRISDTTFPSTYGRILKLTENQQIDPDQGKQEQEDFYLISDRQFHPDIAILQDQTVNLGKFVCLDQRTNKKDDKHVIALKDEMKRWLTHKIVTELDAIRIFLITLRGSFKVVGFEPGLDCPKSVIDLYKKIDWQTQTLWPKNLEGSFEKGYSH